MLTLVSYSEAYWVRLNGGREENNKERRSQVQQHFASCVILPTRRKNKNAAYLQ